MNRWFTKQRGLGRDPRVEAELFYRDLVGTHTSDKPLTDAADEFLEGADEAVPDRAHGQADRFLADLMGEPSPRDRVDRQRGESIAGQQVEGGGRISTPAMTLFEQGDEKTKPKEKVNPLIKASPVVLVKRPYTAPARVQVKLWTDADFTGTGLFTRSNEAIDFYNSEKGGVKLAFDGKANNFQGAALGSGTGVVLWAEGTKPSGSVGGFVLKLALSGGSKTNGPDATAKMTAVRLTLEICEPRAPGGAGGDPAVLPTAAVTPAVGSTPNDKFYLGRPVPVEASSDPIGPSERAMLIIRTVEPPDYTGQVVLEALDDNIGTFAKEKPKDAPKAEKRQLEIPHGKEVKLFVQGLKPSTKVRETGYRLGIDKLDMEGDRVSVTAVYIEAVSDVESAKIQTTAVVPEKPARTSKSKYAPSPLIIGKDYDVAVRPYIELGKAKTWSWSSTSAKVTLTDASKEVLKINGKNLSTALNDVEIELLVTMDVGKMKKLLRLTVVKVAIDPVVRSARRISDAIPNLKHTDDINVIANPAGLLILSSADAKTAPKIEITKIEPNLAWTADDDRIAWRILGDKAPGYPGKAVFLANEKAKRGTKIQVCGTAKGDVLVQPYSGGYGYGMFRATVVDLHQIKYRVQRVFVKAKPAAPPLPAVAQVVPTASHDDAKKHMKLVNIYLRQAGIEMIPDTSAEVAKKAGNPKVGDASLDASVVAVTKISDGHFDVEVNDPTMTLSAAPNDSVKAIRINARNEVLNLAYIHSNNTGALATAQMYPTNHAPLARANPPRAYTVADFTITDSGIPSSSLISKTGIPSDVPADPVKMIVLDMHRIVWQGSSPATRDVNLLWGLNVPTTNLDGSSTATGGNATILAYARAIAHEICHTLGMGHRNESGGTFTDGLTDPSIENVMHPSQPPPDAENLDIIQVKAIRFSEILTRSP